jgi:hypothetical protein
MLDDAKVLASCANVFFYCRGEKKGLLMGSAKNSYVLSAAKKRTINPAILHQSTYNNQGTTCTNVGNFMYAMR